ncbi:hypothetical protein ACHAXN_005842 [Cyclotella atomus]
MTKLSNSPPGPSYNSFTPMATSELTLTYSSSDSDNSRPSTPESVADPAATDTNSQEPAASNQRQQSLLDSSTNLLELEERSYTPTDDTSSFCKMHPIILSALSNRLLHQTVLADKLHHPILQTLLHHGHYAFPLLIGLYLLLLFFWAPLLLLSKLLTETGVYTLLLVTILYIGRCILRLLAFPGTNIKVYGEIELEFARYSCKLLGEGVAGSLEAFGRALLSANHVASQQSSKKGPKRVVGGWDVSDIPSAYKRVVVYRDRVISVYHQVLHCLIKEGGRGYDPSSEKGDESMNFYGSEMVNVCKRNLCCGNNNNNGSEGRALDDLNATAISTGDHPTTRSIPMTKYGNNPLIGDIGNMMNLTPEARSDGRELYTLLTAILDDLSNLMQSASNVIQKIGNAQLKGVTISEDAMAHADSLIQRADELRQFVNRIKPPTSSSSSYSTHDDTNDELLHDEESKVGADAIRHRLEENGTASSSSSTLDMITSAIQSFMAMIDPPPHKYIFGLDVIRGCFLSRYRGAKQFWVQRSGCGSCCSFGRGGQIDVIYIPSLHNNDVSDSVESRMPMSPRQGRDHSILPSSGGGGVKKGRHAVLYCNPNAGLAEVATGLGLIGGNTEAEKDDDASDTTCWTEYYISHGYDVYLFNYCGYGRSHAGTSQTEFQHGCTGSIRRLFYAIFLSFKPTSQTLKMDACAVANHILEFENVDQLVIHGESIGGMAAAGAARALTPASTIKATPTNGTVSLLICDRTFCNLEAVAQRLVGSWTGNAIRLLTLQSWNTDVVSDFLAAKCPKVVANDAADEIIHDYSSLKSGLAFAAELTRGMTNGIGWMMSAPMEYRLADLENVSVSNSTALTFKSFQVNPPTWPADKRITWKEAFHFAFCVRRIGKLATAAKKLSSSNGNTNEEQEGIEVSFVDGSIGHSSSTKDLKASRSDNSELIHLWNTLSCCDGLCGRPLGQAVKEGFDCTVSWLCCAVVMGSQVVVKAAAKRRRQSADSEVAIQPQDFDCRPTGYQRDESETLRHPIPLPNVLSYLKICRRTRLQEVEAEFAYVMGMLEYTIQRISSADVPVAASAWHTKCPDDHNSVSTGCFLNLHCGHNNQYSPKERDDLISLIRNACGEHV